MAIVERLQRALSHPSLLLRYANRLYHQRLTLRKHNPQGISVLEEDWDTLVILDACRYDLFEEVMDLPGQLEQRESRGASTTEFLKANFAGATLLDSVYVTANPQLYRHETLIGSPQFHDVINVWREEGWDDTHGTVLPETVTEYALHAAEEYPNKRLIVHYMQPHYPFIGSAAAFNEQTKLGNNGHQENIWNRQYLGDLSLDRSELWQLYAANLERAKPHVEALLQAINGRTVLTADHGNMFGERSFPIPIREWGHPHGQYLQPLVTVPWLVHDSGPRRTIRADDPQSKSENASVEDGVVADRLRHLGYAE